MGRLFSFKGLMTILLILLAGALGFFGVLIFTDISESDETKNKAATEAGEPEENSRAASSNDVEASKTTFKDAGDLISRAHSFYNDTTGYGELDDGVDWKAQSEQASRFLAYIKSQTFEDPPTLQADMDAVSSYLEKIVNGSKDKSNVKQAHRYFHDLDIAINDFSNYREVWDVTETLGNG
ncbi:hypothetical protein [Thalassobacillus devorans]|uniref:hypothetical protein n=1 Tax=Thalassobacillus devorans TaxID=279813 RepID=UPI0004BA3712|nr:hypothetical protein [Thalassobacillus devorans]